ncbi:hypothetical protein NC653_023332 [Populus alba x Populus x berolinensis]|uniref:Uncharacterized protein n=1 Tax=Populus alba x Populus x berolinensis TaxID=444605 RepID=A0AAD6MH66_9ROSI|nr:hypothetical protein NC653_023332 [Populus alba x Populus x berolinensis]
MVGLHLQWNHPSYGAVRCTSLQGLLPRLHAHFSSGVKHDNTRARIEKMVVSLLSMVKASLCSLAIMPSIMGSHHHSMGRCGEEWVCGGFFSFFFFLFFFGDHSPPL